MRAPAMEKWTNAEWLEALSADRESAWAALREQVVRGLLGYLRSSRPADVDEHTFPALVEDAAQETSMTVRAKLDTFRGESRLTTWVYRIAVNALLTEIRRRRWDINNNNLVAPTGVEPVFES
jgi:RNA polymerase sigma-70 factor (ECF subfamily)